MMLMATKNANGIHRQGRGYKDEGYNHFAITGNAGRSKVGRRSVKRAEKHLFLSDLRSDKY